MKEQNQGLAIELDGLSFKPKMNNQSLTLASTMKSLQQRLPGMMTKSKAHLEKRREEMLEVLLNFIAVVSSVGISYWYHIYLATTYYISLL